MGHTHHHPSGDRSEKNLRLAFFLNLLFSIVEIIGGLLTNSVAILSDALHDLGDALTLGVSWYFARLSKRKRNQTFSYGYKRFSVIGALISAIILTSGSIFILIEAVPRLFSPVTPNTTGMIGLAIAGIVVNGLAAFRLAHGTGINERVVYLHLLEDVMGWIAVLIGAIIMHVVHAPLIDPLLSICISLFILFNVIKNLKEGFRIILQATPSNIDLETIEKTIRAIPRIKDMHDCHVWTMDGEYNVLSVHLVVDSDRHLEDLAAIKESVRSDLSSLGINHTTIEFETLEEDCDPC